MTGGPFPYWTRVWDAGFSMASWLQDRPDMLAGKTVVELGAGLGLPSLVAAKTASSVCITDQSEAAIAWAWMNITKATSAQVTAANLSWKENRMIPADIVLMSDVGYDPTDFLYLEQLAGRYLAAGAMILMTVPLRIVSSTFVEVMQRWICERAVDQVNGKEVIQLVLKN